MGSTTTAQTVSVDEMNEMNAVHSEANQIIDELLDSASTNVTVSVAEAKQREREMLLRAKEKYTPQIKEMIATSDSWFINEDGDIVMIYPDGDGDADGDDAKEAQAHEVEQEDERAAPDVDVADESAQG